MKEANGSYGEFLRVDLTGDYGDLAANLQTVTWTYYGDDSTYTNAKATYGTKFAADNWMHKVMGISLALPIPCAALYRRNGWNRLLEDYDSCTWLCRCFLHF